MRTQRLQDGAESFDVSVHEGASASPIALFAVGSGGEPGRHGTLLGALAGAGFTVVAPHFERLTTSRPSEADLVLRARRLSLALDAFLPIGASAAGVGHSIGAATLIALAGARMWLGPGRRVEIDADYRLTRLALLAPPTGFFRAPGALADVQVPALVWAGSQDHITPPAQSEWLADALGGGQQVDHRVTAGAGHFSFMDEPPPHITDPLPNRKAFLEAHASEVCRFLAG